MERFILKDFWIKDNRDGVTCNEQVRLFPPFSRFDDNRVTGHGLGLSPFRCKIDNMEGQVGVKSEEENGSRFFFTLPLAENI
ncbi:MAG: ATP-binding protein [Candidatus Hodarchaeales archaeon]|jgi:signal transduction histidine kinase